MTVHVLDPKLAGEEEELEEEVPAVSGTEGEEGQTGQEGITLEVPTEEKADVEKSEKDGEDVNFYCDSHQYLNFGLCF